MKNINHKDVSVIPKGLYCYDIIKISNMKIIRKRCPYLVRKKFGKVSVSYCNYLELGDVGNNISNKEYKQLLLYFGSREKMEKVLPLFLLWDECKECGKNKY